MTKAAAIFDLDGTLVDSEPVYQESDLEFLARHGVRIPRDATEDFVGLDGREVIRRMKELHGLEGDEEELLREKNDMFFETAVQRVKTFPPTLELAHTLAGAGYPLAIATATPIALREKVVKLCRLEALFPIRVSAEEVDRGKPAPDVFEEAARRMGVPPDRCVVLEDSRYGVMGAKAAGMRVVALPENPASSAFANADYLVPGGARSLDPRAAYAWITSVLHAG